MRELRSDPVRTAGRAGARLAWIGAMAHVDCTDFLTDVEAPAEEAFALMNDYRAWSSWTRAIKDAWARSEGPWREGFEFVMKTMITRVPFRLEVVELEPGRRVAWQSKNVFVTVTHRIDFEPLDAKRCRVRNHEYVEGVLGNLVGKLLRKPIDRLDRQWAADLAAHFAAEHRAS
jgi:hypothetical protein